MSQLEIFTTEYMTLMASISEYREALKYQPGDWILALHLSRAENRVAFLEREFSAHAA